MSAIKMTLNTRAEVKVKLKSTSLAGLSFVDRYGNTHAVGDNIAKAQLVFTDGETLTLLREDFDSLHDSDFRGCSDERQTANV